MLPQKLYAEGTRLLNQSLTRRDFLKISAAAAGSLLMGVPAAHGASTTQALINGNLIDGTGAAALSDAVVVIRDRRILAVGSRAEVAIPPDAQRIDLTGGTLLPGFINAHIHGGYSDRALKGWARGGVTTVRDLAALGPYSASLFKTRDTLCARPSCARLVAVGSFINATGGYPIAYWNGFAVTVASPADARKAVNRLIGDGADVIKTAFESGYAFNRSGWPLLPPETARALVAASHERGVPVTAHVTSANDLPRALDAGVDEIAHMVVDPCPNDLIARTVEAGIRWVPTLELWQGVSRRHHLDYDKVAVENLARFVQAGGEVALGTDYEGAPISFELGMPQTEIRLMAAAGMRPDQIVTAATLNAARACNLEKEIGTLEPGKAADLLVVDGDPRTDLKAFAQTRLVLREGQVVSGA